MAARPEHEDVRAGAEDPFLEAVDDDRVNLGMLEADPLNGVGELDVDAEVVRVQLQTVVTTQACVLLDVHRERRHRTIERKLPVFVAARMGVEGNRREGGRLLHRTMLLRADSSRRKAQQPRSLDPMQPERT